ncbi:rod shape-determining protein MreD [Vagococcus xieshaowenii]|uniref:Rod shape-determining protein MreD n=1 Tax=Vagococcus xieshaowenii TaxID=2562451 RepID=A0AAJ5JMD0_9ENTE|nr:rod shape-determining protein MreD [Vagococcus xieshaowenii]QCA27993.1 rod shape-determining protein MreD [Vagococcus xieshaowenii]TFZ41240.1 rod shape-determining protein MreD [Vagococcus xieshaowenii]
MKENIVIKIWLPFLLLMVTLLDSQLSNILRIAFENQYVILSHFMLLGLILASLFFNQRYMTILSIILGLIIDNYYYGILGIWTVSLPITVSIAYWIFKYIKPSIPSLFLSLVIFITLLDSSAYFIQVVFGLIEGNFINFIARELGPTLIMNIFFFVILAYPINKLLNRKR